MEYKNTYHYDESEDKMVVEHTYDAQPVLDSNKRIKNSKSAKSHNKYGADTLCHVGRLHQGDVQRLFDMGYNLLSPDPEEVRRALMYIQSNEPHLLLVHGKPFAKTRPKWA